MLLGAAAGAAGTWVMDQVTTVLYEREPDAAREREDRARGDKTAYAIVVEKAAKRAGLELSEDHQQLAATAIHWSTGVGAGAAYGALRHGMPRLGLGSGVLFGMAVFLALDEAALTLMGIVPPPREFPWQTHARGLAGHLVLGALIEAPFDLID